MWLFNFGALPYDVLTAQPLWRDQIARLLDYLPAPPKRVLDLGCGPGVSTFVLAEKLGAGAKLWGVDLSPPMIARAQRHHGERYPHLTNIQFAQADAKRLPFDAGHFDLATGHSFLYLVADRAAVLAEVRRVLRPGGHLILMEPRRDGSLATAARRLREIAGPHRPWDAARFLTSMVLWRTVAALHGALAPVEIDHLFRAAGFADVATHETLAGLGMHCVGRA